MVRIVEKSKYFFTCNFWRLINECVPREKSLSWDLNDSDAESLDEKWQKMFHLAKGQKIVLEYFVHKFVQALEIAALTNWTTLCTVPSASNYVRPSLERRILWRK